MNEVLNPEAPIVAYNPVRAAIAQLVNKYEGVLFDVSTTKGMEAAKAARAEIREPRYNIEKIRKELKAPALAYSKRIDDEAKEYTASLLSIETPIDEVIKVEETRKAAEKAERERIEEEQRRKVQSNLTALMMRPAQMVGKPSARISQEIAQVNALAIDEANFGQMVESAQSVKATTLQQLEAMEKEARVAEDDRARMEAQRIALAKREAELEATRKELKAKLEQARQESAQQEEVIVMSGGMVAIDVAFKEPEPMVSRAPAPATPSAHEIIAVVAQHYDVSIQTAAQWIAAIAQEVAA